MRSFLVLILILFHSIFSAEDPHFSITLLTCEQKVNPTAVNRPKPALSWQIKSDRPGTSQTAYRILVAGSPEKLAANQGDYWDSGRQSSSASVLIPYGGLPLKSRDKVFWKVMIWDEKGTPSAWSAPASWSAGLLNRNDWQAEWITSITDPLPDSAINYPAPFFRKEFSVRKKVKDARVFISGLGFYALSINGKKIGEQVLAPAVTNYDKRVLKSLLYPYDDQSTQRVFYNDFQVADKILPGKNSIGIVLGDGWYNQRNRTVEGKLWYDVPKLIFQLEIRYTDGTKQTVVSDRSWKTSTGPLLSNGLFSGEIYDARKELNGWEKAGYPDRAWRQAISAEAPTGELEAQTAPFDKVLRTIAPQFRGKKKLTSIYALDETVSGWAAIQVRGPRGSRVEIRYISEEGEDYGQKDTYILKSGATEYREPEFTWHAFRSIEITADNASVQLEKVTVKDVHTDVPKTGTFACSDTLLNTIYAAYQRTQKANFHGSISSDCPHRERLGYTGDGQVAMESVLYAYDAFQFYRKWLNDMDDARNHKTGFVPHTAPFAGGGGGPAWGSAYVIMPWLYYAHYGDTTILRQHYSGMKQWVNYLQTRTNEKGLITKEEPGGWCLGEWGTPTEVKIPEPLVNTAYFYHVADLAARTARVLGLEEDQKTFTRLAGEIKAHFNAAYYNPSTHSYWQGAQGADVFPLAFGLVPDGDEKQVFASLLKHLERLDHHFDTGILGTPLLLDVLSRNDRDDLAFKIMTQKDFPGFGYLLDSKNSMLWEFWDGKGSHAHPMFGSVVSWCYAGLAGIRADPEHPGMKHFIIAPKTVKELRFCRSSCTSLYGRIRSEWKKTDTGKLRFSIVIPPNTTATFMLPEDKRKGQTHILVNGHAQAVSAGRSVAFTSGSYEFEI
ncbi:MAG: family 78 glycoside hydrolase catalytic domain [Mucilaginibacter polytrichastri]|nr:family 78 glycoside hydrolase catalytic domain [Mucilaginibacter polytrichastri]